MACVIIFKIGFCHFSHSCIVDSVFLIFVVSSDFGFRLFRSNFAGNVCSPCNFSPLAEIPGCIELLENSLTFEGVHWRKIIQCVVEFRFLSGCVFRADPVPLCCMVYAR